MPSAWTFTDAMEAIESYEFQIGVCVGAGETQGPTWMKLYVKRDEALEWLRDCCAIGAPLLAAAQTPASTEEGE